eukprot:559741-Pleurochrysis_carterae.AAC.4
MERFDVRNECIIDHRADHLTCVYAATKAVAANAYQCIIVTASASSGDRVDQRFQYSLAKRLRVSY